MEWLINRRRMMLNRAIPATYLTFEDEEFWRICCLTYGDYEETVITDNGDNTVDIVVTLKSQMVNSNQYTVAIKNSEVINSMEGVDNSGGEYIAGTTKTPVGITQKQCDAVTILGCFTWNGSLSDKFKSNTLITSVNDLTKFRNITQIFGNAGNGHLGGFSQCINIETASIPNSLHDIGDRCFYKCSKITSFDFKNIRTMGREAFQETKITEVVLNEGFTAMYGGGTSGSYGPFKNVTTIKYYDFPSTTVTLQANDLCLRSATQVIVCRATTPPTLATQSNPLSSIKIYVPSASVDTYKAASNWSALANQIYAIEGTWYETHRELEPAS